MIAFRLPLTLAAALLLAGTLAAAAPLEDADTEIARRHFEKGRRLYEQRRYEEALAEFHEARLAKPLPALDFNIAKCLERLERYEPAIAAYLRYEERSDDPFEAEEARQRVQALKERVAALAALRRPTSPPPAPLPTAATAPPSEPPPSSAVPSSSAPPPREPQPPLVEARDSGSESAPGPNRPVAPRPPLRFALPLGLGIGAAAVALVGAALLGSVVAPYGELRRTCRPNCGDAEVAPLETRANAGYVFLALAGAAATADVIVWILAARATKPRITVVPSVSGIALAGAF